MRVSIVTISFNQGRYVEQTIRSILEQDYPDIEYIVVDAGSTDGSREVINNHRHLLARVILEPDRGPADGLNKGFMEASGEVFGFVNADDRLLPEAVTKVVRFLEHNPQAKAVYGHGFVVDGGGRRIRRVYADPFNVRRFAHGCVTFMQPSLFFRRGTFIEVGGFNIQNRTCWDGELLADFGLHGAAPLLIDDFLCEFRIHDQSFGSTKPGTPYRVALAGDAARIFRKSKGRDRRWYDRYARIACRLEKWCKNPRGFQYNVSRALGIAR